MNNTIIAVGNIVTDVQKGTKYRIIAIINNEVILCEMEVTKFNLYCHSLSIIVDLLSSGQLLFEEEGTPIFDENLLSESIKTNFIKKRNVMNEVMAAYAPTFLGLSGKKPKPQLQEILTKYSYPTPSFWRICVLFFQCGMKDYSLVDSKAFGVNKGKKYQYSTKPGKRTEYFEATGVVLNEEIISYFEESLKEYKNGRHKTINSTFDRMNMLHFTRTELIDGVTNLVLLPESQRPTKRQFSYYISRHLTLQEKDIIKTSAIEQRNNKRLIVSDSLDGVCGPGDMVEIDACEADVSLVSSFDSNQTIGRPIVYFMIDVYTRIILAASIAFDNNSVLGVTNLFLNLADDKQEYCSHFGMGFDNVAIKHNLGFNSKKYIHVLYSINTIFPFKT